MSLEKVLRHFPPQESQRLLDLGCGDGTLVEAFRTEGIDAYGCDILDSNVSDYSERPGKDYLKSIELEPYRLPFDDSLFDYVVSQVVLEHVMDMESTFGEIWRVLKPGGISVHTFPSRYRFLEQHVFVPFASLHRSRAWLYFWALMGIRNQFQIGKTAGEVAELNYQYLNNHTNYPKDGQILGCAHMFSYRAFREDLLFSLPPWSPVVTAPRSLFGRMVPEFLKVWRRTFHMWWGGKLGQRVLILKK